MKLQLIVHSKNQRKNYDLSAALDGSINYTTQRVGSASKITFDIIKEGEMVFHEGDKISILKDGTPYIVGYIFQKAKAQEKISVTAYDLLRYLQYKQSYSFKAKTAGQIIRQMAGEFLIPTGELVETGYVLPDKIYEDKTLLDIATDALMLTSIETKKVYTLYDDAGKLTLKEAEQMKSKFVLGNKSFATDYTYTTSIEESYSIIKLVRPNKETGKSDAYIAQEPQKIERWGKLQLYKKVDEKMNPAQIKDLAENLLKYHAQTSRSLKVSAVGISEIRAGSMVLLDIQDLGDIALKKMLLIDKCTHKLSEHDHTMDLEMRVYNG